MDMEKTKQGKEDDGGTGHGLWFSWVARDTLSSKVTCEQRHKGDALLWEKHSRKKESKCKGPEARSSCTC